MLDIQFIRDNAEMVALKSKQKGYKVDVPKLLALDSQRRELLTAVEALRARRNENAAKMKNGKPEPALIDEGKQIKLELSKKENYLQDFESEYASLLKAIPNMPLDDVPVGATEDENVVAKKVGEPTKFDFTPKNHWEILEPRDMLDKERAAKISGSRFAYIKGDLVRMQLAIMQFVMQTLGDEAVIQKLIDENDLHISAKPFMPVLPPALLRTEPYVASARLNAEEVTYKIEQDDLWLNASAEHTLCTMYWNEILPEDMFPIRYIGYSTSFRREAGTYGKDTEGMIRLHQFDKLEMEVFSTAETALDEHKLQVAIQEYLVQQIGLPYQLLQKCTFDIGKPNARGIDLECWFPGQQKYRETHTADYMTDYQARDLKIRVRRNQKPLPEDTTIISSNEGASAYDGGAVQLVHTNDATAFAMSRILACIVENYQTADGHIKIPAVLVPFMNGKTEI